MNYRVLFITVYGPTGREGAGVAQTVQDFGVGEKQAAEAAIRACEAWNTKRDTNSIRVFAIPLWENAA